MKIHVTQTTRKSLMTLWGINQSTLSKILSYQINTYFAHSVRVLIFNYYQFLFENGNES